MSWRPIAKPQWDFCRAKEDEVFYGGAKGGMKSDAIVFGCLDQVHLPRYKALILRQTFGEVQELIDRSHRVFPYLAQKPKWNGELKRWQFPLPGARWGSGGPIVKFGHCKTVDEVEIYHGGEWAYIGFDELADVPDQNIWINLIAENRCPNPDVRTKMRGTGNPGRPGHAWCKRRFILPCGKTGRKVYVWKSQLPGGQAVEMTRRFIPSKVTDNPIYRNDPVYMARLLSLPDILRRQLLEGDWDAGFGLALDELDEGMHFVPPFKPPENWRRFGAFDWGYAHPWIFGEYTISEDGVIYKVQTIRGRLMSDRRIAERINQKVDIEDLSYIAAGHDCWAEHKARRDDRTPSTAERFAEAKIYLTRANIARYAGLKNFREQVAWKGIIPGTPPSDGEPNFFWMDTEENRQAFEAVQGIVIDPDDAEDALEADADRVSGEGGDDDYDENRYALASRPARTMPTWTDQEVRAFSRAALEAEYERTRRHKSQPLIRYEEIDGGGY